MEVQETALPQDLLRIRGSALEHHVEGLLPLLPLLDVELRLPGCLAVLLDHLVAVEQPEELLVMAGSGHRLDPGHPPHLLHLDPHRPQQVRLEHVLELVSEEEIEQEHLASKSTMNSIFIHFLQQNLASSRELASGPGDDVLVVGPRVKGLEPPAGQDRLGVPKQVLLGWCRVLIV